MTTSDLYPTLLSLMNVEVEHQPRPIDGKDMTLLLQDHLAARGEPIAFYSMAWRAYMDNRFKIVSEDGGKQYALYDLVNDPSETTDLAKQHPQRLQCMIDELEAWIASCRNSARGRDYALPN